MRITPLKYNWGKKQSIRWLFIKTRCFLLCFSLVTSSMYFFPWTSLECFFFFPLRGEKKIPFLQSPSPRANPPVADGSCSSCVGWAGAASASCSALPSVVHPLLGVSRCTAVCKFKICFEENWGVFFPKTSCFWASLPASLLRRVFAEMEFRGGMNATKLNIFTGVEGLGCFRLVKLAGVRTVTSYSFMVPYMIGP